MQEGDISDDDLSNYEDDALDCDIPSPSGPPSRLAASLATHCGDLEGTPIFRADERDDSRYFGKLYRVHLKSAETHSNQENPARYQSYHAQG